MTNESTIITICGVRCYLDENNTAWINLEDVARGLGFTEKAQSGNITIRWRTVNSYLESFGAIATSCDGFIPENIFYRLAMKAKNEVAEKFQAKVADEILPTIRKTGSYSVDQAPSKGVKAVRDIRFIADEIQQNFIGVKRGIAMSKAIDISQETNGVMLETLKELIPPAEHETGYLNATELGKKLGVSAQQTNKMLEEAKLQYKDGKDWRISENGKVYGEEMPYTRNGNSGYQLRWNYAIIAKLGGLLQ